MTRILLHQVEQHPLQGRRLGAVPAWPRLAALAQIMRGDDDAAALRLAGESRRQLVQGLVRVDVPPVVALVTPRLGDVPALEPALQPTQLDVRQVLEQLDRRPSRRQPAPPKLVTRQLPQLAEQPVAEEVEVAQETARS